MKIILILSLCFALSHAYRATTAVTAAPIIVSMGPNGPIVMAASARPQTGGNRRPGSRPRPRPRPNGQRPIRTSTIAATATSTTSSTTTQRPSTIAISTQTTENLVPAFNFDPILQ